MKTLAKSLILTLSSALLLSGCLGNDKLTCSNPDGTQLVQEIIIDGVEKSLIQHFAEFNISNNNPEKFRSNIKNLQFNIIDIRIAKEDPNSTKIFCQASVEIVFPKDTVTRFDKIIKENSEAFDNQKSFAEMIQAKHKHLSPTDKPNAFATDVYYNLQPSDNGEKIFAEVENHQELTKQLQPAVFLSIINPEKIKELIELMAELKEFASNFDNAFGNEKLNPSILDSSTGDQIALNTSEIEEQLQQEIDESLSNLEHGEENTLNDLESAKTAFHQAHEQLNTAWNQLSSDVKDSIRDEQRNYNAEREETCRMQAESIANDNVEREYRQLTCETESILERIAYLQQF